MGAEGEDPAEELVAQGDVHDGFRPASALARLDGNVAAEAVEHDAHILIGKCDADGCLLASEHGKVHPCVLCQIELAEGVPAGSQVIFYYNILSPGMRGLRG